MKTYIRIHIKNEKRIIKLLYRKGLLDEFKVDMKGLGWESLRPGKKPRKRKSEYRSRDYIPELHGYTVDYWGEGDSYGVVDYILQGLYWKFSVDGTEDYATNGGWPDSTFKYRGQIWFIKYLQQMPSRFRSSKINEVLRIGYNY